MLEPSSNILQAMQRTEQQVHLMEEAFDCLATFFEFRQILESICHDRVGDHEQARDTRRYGERIHSEKPDRRCCGIYRKTKTIMPLEGGKWKETSV